jgi:hypothetical protein
MATMYVPPGVVKEPDRAMARELRLGADPRGGPT